MTDVTYEQLERVYAIWQSHGTLIRTIIDNCKEGRTDSDMAVKLLAPFAEAILKAHEVMAAAMAGFEEAGKA